MHETEWQIFVSNLEAVLDWWYALIPGLLLSLIDVVERSRGKEAPISPRWILRVFLIGMILAQYLAYRDLKKETVASKPDFSIYIGQSVTGDYLGDTAAMPYVKVINRGADSSIVGWSAHFTSPTVNQSIELLHIQVSRKYEWNGQSITIGPENDITNNTRMVPRGATIDGRIVARIPGNHKEELESCKGVITISAFDYLNNPFSGQFCGGPAPVVRYGTGEHP